VENFRWQYFSFDITFSGIIPSDYIAGVVRDGNFSGHMIKENTQVVFMDEWTSDSLCCEDAKRVLQGKYQSTMCIQHSVNSHASMNCFFYP